MVVSDQIMTIPLEMERLGDSLTVHQANIFARNRSRLRRAPDPPISPRAQSNAAHQPNERSFNAARCGIGSSMSSDSANTGQSACCGRNGTKTALRPSAR